MSETPRLSRRELRELGKLQARPADAESISETAELQLRRPTRKELRERELARRAKEAEQAEGKEVEPSVDDQSHDEPVFDDSSALGETSSMGAVTTGDASTETSPAADKPAGELADEQVHPDPEQTDVSASSAAVAETQVVPTQPGSAFVSSSTGADVAEKPADSAGKEPADDVDPDKIDTDEVETDDVAAEADADDQPQRRMSVFDRFDENEESERSLSERLRDRTKQRGDEDSRTDVAEDEDSTVVAESAGTSEAAFDADVRRSDSETEGSTTTVAAPSAPTATDFSPRESDPEPVEEEAPRRTWLNYILLILIAITIGYLGGSWINSNWLSDAPQQLDVVLAAGHWLL